jgi:3-deoxy-D-manno-octulosonate 8-phosphate phosphatase (KDO 8-P phosphatase)
MPIPNYLDCASKIRLVLTDCDGVLTDAGVYYSARGEEMKRFNIRDGMGRKLLWERAGVDTVIVTGEVSESVKRRAEKLKITELHLDAQDKLSLLAGICRRRGLEPEQIAYIGDDVNDIALLEKVGFSACPADAVEAVKGIVHVVLTQGGGHGAFREFAEIILAAKR